MFLQLDFAKLAWLKSFVNLCTYFQMPTSYTSVTYHQSAVPQPDQPVPTAAPTPQVTYVRQVAPNQSQHDILASIPVMPMGWAVTCCVLNTMIPGFGKVVSFIKWTTVLWVWKNMYIGLTSSGMQKSNNLKTRSLCRDVFNLRMKTWNLRFFLGLKIFTTLCKICKYGKVWKAIFHYLFIAGLHESFF